MSQKEKKMTDLGKPNKYAVIIEEQPEEDEELEYNIQQQRDPKEPVIPAKVEESHDEVLKEKKMTDLGKPNKYAVIIEEQPEEDEELEYNIQQQRDPKEPVIPAKVEESHDEDKYKSSIRKGDTTFSKPDRYAKWIEQKVPPANQTDEAKQNQKSGKAKELEENTFANQSLKRIQQTIGFFRHFFMALVVLFLIGFLFIINQGVETYFNIIELPLAIKTLYLFLMLLIISISGYYLYKVFSLYLKLKESPQINIPSIQAIVDWEKEKKEESKILLKQYMKDYTERTDLLKIGFNDTDKHNLIVAKQKLSDIRYRRTEEDWFDDYYLEFQKVIDKHADKIIKNNSLLIALKTALLPGKLFDSLVVFYMNIKTTKDLMRIYKLRMSNASAILLFFYIFISTYIIAGSAEELTEQSMATIMEEANLGINETTIATFGVDLLGKLGPKIAEGTINYYFSRRIGNKTKDFLQPINKLDN